VTGDLRLRLIAAAGSAGVACLVTARSSTPQHRRMWKLLGASALSWERAGRLDPASAGRGRPVEAADMERLLSDELSVTKTPWPPNRPT
jgi:hypothetical protein